MHSFDNGAGVPSKENNWFLLKKFFKKKGVPVKPEMIDDVIKGKVGITEQILEAVYTFLTNKKFCFIQINFFLL